MQVKSTALLAILLFLAQLPVMGKLAAVENKPSSSSKLLKGGVNRFGVLSEKMMHDIGLDCIEDDLGLLVSQVVESSKAKRAGLSRGDYIYSARIENQNLVLEIMRDDNEYKATISLSNKLQVQKPVLDLPQAKVQRARVATVQNLSRDPRVLKLVNPQDGPCIRIAFFGPQQLDTYQRTTQSGFNLNGQDIQSIYTFETEYKGQNSAQGGGWGGVNTATYEFARTYTNKNWPRDLIGHRTYHLVVRKDGSFLDCDRMFQKRYDRLSTDEGTYERLCLDFLNRLNRSRILAIPSGSNLDKWHCMIVFCNKFERSE